MSLDMSTPVGFIGAGRLGASLAVAMSARGYDVAAVQRRSMAAAGAVAKRISRCYGTVDAQKVAHDAGIVFITTPDAAIQPVAESLDWSGVDAVVHCSGATPVSALESARAGGASIGGIHPMQTFPTERCDDRFERITMAVEAADEGLERWLHALASCLGANSFILHAAQRPAYHASAVMACGLVAGLVGLAADMWREMGMSREDGLRALTPLVTATARQIGELGIPAAITGPYARGDAETVRSHLAATRGSGGDVALGYAALALAQLPIAREQGNISNEEYAIIEALLRAALAPPGS